ncbi:MAG: BlaI/MecI/CopY family transcriptional regulator [Lachnospiraceae bacterium]|nr:BlaI/MecI/CopY family transcriptional regulator [Lachnospiraceae bacterium]
MRLKNLTDCEQLVMKTLWDAEKEIGLMEITRRVNEAYDKDWKPQTVSTFLARLVRKSYLESYRQGRVFFYRILVPQMDYVGEMAEQFIAFWNRGSVEEFLEALEKRRAK